MQKETDCIFIFAPGKENRESSFDYHLGAGYIISLLKSNGFSARQFVHKEPVILKDAVGEILAGSPKIAGFTIYDTNFNTSVLIAEQVKRISPRTLVVFGGPSSSVHYEFIMSTYPFVDACFLNDGEETFLQFITKYAESHFEYDKTDLTEINGISFRLGLDTISKPAFRKAGDKTGCRNYLDRFPSPYLTGNIPPEEGRNTGILTSRGCNQNCIYCNCSVLSGKKVLTHSVNRVIGELDLISRYAGKRGIINFQDDTFTLFPQRAREICNEIIRNKIQARLTCITRCDTVDETLLDVMKEAGFISLIFSLESASPEILRRIGKVHAAEDFPSDGLEKELMFLERFNRVAAYAKKIGFKNVTTSVMIGLPGETISEANKTIATVNSNNNIDHYSHNFLKIFKGTPLSHNYEKYGYKLRLINDNPVFLKMIYPEDYAGKVCISPKSHLHSLKEENDKSTLGILALTSEVSNINGFRNIILLSDHVQVKFIKWLKEVLAINGTIIQLYSCEKAMTRLRDRNYEKFIRYCAPSLNIRSYCPNEKNEAGGLLSPESLLLKSNDTDNIRICDFRYFRSGLDEHGFNFARTLCREADYTDAVAAHSFLVGVSREKDPFTFLTGMKALPYFANLCRWTGDHANCVTRSTLIVNEMNEVRFCWNGSITGSVGNSYKEIINKLDIEILNTKIRRECIGCKEKSSCIKCAFPFPLPEDEYCRNKKTSNTVRAAELIIGLDQIKQIFS